MSTGPRYLEAGDLFGEKLLDARDPEGSEARAWSREHRHISTRTYKHRHEHGHISTGTSKHRRV
eukprot:587097-Rhodomonas_salina.2